MPVFTESASRVPGRGSFDVTVEHRLAAGLVELFMRLRVKNQVDISEVRVSVAAVNDVGSGAAWAVAEND